MLNKNLALTLFELEVDESIDFKMSMKPQNKLVIWLSVSAEKKEFTWKEIKQEESLLVIS
jgi:hypothetical protein